MDGYACGMQNHTRNTIQIRNDMPRTQQEVTLIHELFHALNPTYGAKEGDVEHGIIEFYAQGLYAIFKENDLFKEL